MKRIICAIALLLAAAAPGVLARGSSFAQSVGFFPATIDVAQGLRGQEYIARTTLVNQTDEGRMFELSTRGDIAGWVTYADPEDEDTAITTLELAPGSEKEILLRIAIPEGTPNGVYSGMNVYDGYTADAFESREGVVTGFEQPLNISVTGDQVIDLTVGDVSARHAEVGMPLRIQSQLTNRGNVDVAPVLTVAFVADAPGTDPSNPLAELETEIERVRPGESTTRESGWDTTGQEPGEYVAHYTISLDGERIAVGSFPFSLLPPGSLSPSGTIMSMALAGEAEPGVETRVDVVFENSGAIEGEATLEAAVYQDGVEVVEAVNPAGLPVRPNEQVELSAYFTLPPGSSGNFEIRGRVLVNGQEADAGALAFSTASDERPITMWLAAGGVAAFAVGAVTLGGMWFYRRRA